MRHVNGLGKSNRRAVGTLRLFSASLVQAETENAVRGRVFGYR